MSTPTTPPHRLTLRRVVIEKIASDALIESGGEGDALVSLPYVFLLELIDGYKAAGWVREFGPVNSSCDTQQTLRDNRGVTG